MITSWSCRHGTVGNTPGQRYGDILGRNISGARGRLQLSQAAVSARMRALGFEWHQQTCMMSEKGRRRVTAEEIHGLARVLETSIARLMSPTDDDKTVTFPDGSVIPAASVQRSAVGENDGAVQWAGNTPVIPRPRPARRPGMAASG